MAGSPKPSPHFGIRVDRNGNPICHDGCYTQYIGGFPDSSATLDTPYNATLSAGHDSFAPAIERAIVQPRVGFNLDLRGDGKTVVRGGVGLFSDSFPGLVLEQTFLSFPQPVFCGRELGNSCAGGRQCTSGRSRFGRRCAERIFARRNLQPDLRGAGGARDCLLPSKLRDHAAYLQKRALYGIQPATSASDHPKRRLNSFYAGNHGYDLFIGNNHLNQNVGTSLYGSYGNGTFDDVPINSPDPRFAQVQSFTNNAISNYSGVSVQYKHIDRRGLTANVSYTYAHSLDDISNGGNSQLPYNGNTSIGFQITPDLPSRLMYSNSDYDIRNNFLFDLVYVEPFHFSNKFVAAGPQGGLWAARRTGVPGNPSACSMSMQSLLWDPTGQAEPAPCLPRC